MPKPKPRKPQKRLTDARTLAAALSDRLEQNQEISRETLSRLMAAMGRRGGLKGGKARKDALSPERRKEIAQQGGIARWQKTKSKSSSQTSEQP